MLNTSSPAAKPNTPGPVCPRSPARRSVPNSKTKSACCEFDARGEQSGAVLFAKLSETVEEAIRVIASLTTEQLITVREIQGSQVSGVHALLHVVEHFAQHTGQIILLTKALTGEDLGFYRHLNPRPA